MPNTIIPKNIPEARRQIQPQLEWLARWLDNVFEIPGLGIRFGFDSIIGLIPGIGATVTSLASLYILEAARRHGVARVTLVRMALNIVIDTAVGAIPFVGDLFDLYWKANLKNLALLREHLDTTPEEERRARRGDWLFVGALSLGVVAVVIAGVIGSYLALKGLVQLLAR